MSGGVTGDSLVLTAVRLRWALLRAALRSGPGAWPRRIGMLVGALAGLGLATGSVVALTLARGRGTLAEDGAVLLFCVLTAGWVVLPVLTFAADDLLDPGKLALLPLSRRELMTVTGVAALVGVAPVVTLLAALALVPATADGAWSVAVALASVVLLLALCVGASRAVVSVLSGFLRSRRGRDLGVALAALVALSGQLINPLLQLAARSEGGDALAGLAGPLSWTPAGVLARAPGRSPGWGLASLLLVAAVVAASLAVWERSIRRLGERPGASGPRRRRATALEPRWIPLPADRAGAIAAKDLRYLARDPRRLLSSLLGLLVPVVAVVAGPVVVSGGRPPAATVFAVCGIGLLSGLAGANRFGLDGTATWMLVASGTRPGDARRDLLGGDLAVAVVAVPPILLAALTLAAWSDGWAYLAPAVGTALALLALALALAGYVAVSTPYAVPQTQNAFGGGGGGQGVVAGLLVLGVVAVDVVACLPLLVLLVPAVVGPPVWGLLLLVVGPLYGLGLGVLVRRRAARVWAARGPEVLAVLSTAGPR